MYNKIKISLALFSVIFYVCGAVPLVSKCKEGDSKCAVQSANQILSMFALGIPEYGVNSADPLLVKQVDLSSPNLKLVASDINITGLKNTVMKQIKLDTAKSKLTLKLSCNIQLEGQYEMNGRLLFLRLEGKGPVHVTVKKMDITLNVHLKEIDGEDGAKHWRISFKDYSYTFNDKSTVVFENLFDGNDILAGAAKEVIAASGNEIINEVGGNLIKDVALKIVDEINHFFEAVPVTELIIDS